MSDIPEDVMKVAADLSLSCAKWFASGSTAEPFPSQMIAHAIMAEREAERDRCFAIRPDPDITTEDPEKPYTSGYVEGFWDAVARYRAAIWSPRP